MPDRSGSIFASGAPTAFGFRVQACLNKLAALFRRLGWKVKDYPALGERRADLIVSRDGFRYLVELKAASEGRRDRLVPLLSQAILEAQSIARTAPAPAAAMAVIAAPAIPPSVVTRLERFAAENASGVAIGILDGEGLQRFSGPGLDRLNAPRPSRGGRKQLAMARQGDFFSDLNQWMLKVLLAPLLPEDLLSAPRRDYLNASQLAESAGVSVMSAFRFVRRLRQEGFLEKDEVLHLVHREELMRRWQAAHLGLVPELPLRWMIPGRGSERRLKNVLKTYFPREHAPRACLRLLAAAGELGFGSLRGAAPRIYLESLDLEFLAQLGLSPKGAEDAPDVVVRVPTARESVFRAAVLRDRVPVTDILQLWLDVAADQARGPARAEEIRRRALGAIFKEGT